MQHGDNHYSQHDTPQIALRALWITGVIIIIVCLVIAIAMLANRYQTRIRDAEARLEQLSAIYDENILLLMANLESMMRSAGTEYLNNQNISDLDTYLGTTVEHLPHLDGLFVLDANGIVVADSRLENNAVGNDNSEGILFTVHLDDENDKLFIRDPLLTDFDNSWVLPVSYGLHDENGNLVSVVVATIDANYFSGALSETISSNDAIMGYIFNVNQIVLASIPFQTDQIGVAFPDHPLFTENTDLAFANLLQGDSIISTDSHVIASRSVNPYEFAIVFAQPKSTLLEPFQVEATLIVLIAIAIAGITMLVLWYIYQQTRQMLVIAQARHRKEVEFRTLAENVVDIIVRFDKGLRHVYVNPALLKTTGLKEKDYVGKTNRDLGMPDEQVAFWDKETQRVFDTGQDNIIEFAYEAVNGKRWFQGHLTPEFDETGEVITVLSVVRDITSLKLAQQQLEAQKRSLQSQYRYQRAMTQLGLLALEEQDLQSFMDQFVAIIAENLDVEYTKILELTPDKKRLFLRAGVGWHEGLVGVAYIGTEQQSQAGYTLSISEPVIVNSLPDETRFQGPKLLTDHDVISGMSTIIHTSSEPYGVLGIHTTHARAFSSQDIEFLQGIAGLLSTVIQFKQAEYATNRERNLLRTIIDNIPDYIFVKDNQLRFIETNLAHASAGGVFREEMIGRTATELFDEALARQFHSDDEQILQSGQPIINEERVTTDSEGSQRWMLTSKVPLEDEDGQIIGLIGISRDITTRRQAEMDRQEAERLQFEIEQERQLLEVKEQFITTASHNFRTPLAIIRSGTDILDRYLEQYTPEEQRVKLRRIQKQVDHMNSLLNEVLTLHKLSSGKVELKTTRFDLQALCQRIWDDMSLVDGSRHPKNFQYIATQTTIVADESLLQQIIHNLLSNAFKYTPDGQSITFQIDSDDDGFILTVEDDGIGIPDNDLSQLFQPFHRASNTDAIQGTGLGLAIIKEYVELHQGQVTVESEEGEGTTFSVRLPFNDLNTT